MEQWATCIYDGVIYENYEVSTKGRVRNKRGQIKKQFDNKGYLIVCFSVKGVTKNCYVHRLVATAFKPNPDNLTDVDHIDKDRKNNCVDNLRWLSHPNNVIHSLAKKIKCVNTGQIFDSLAQASEVLGVSSANICRVLKGERNHTGGYVFEYVEIDD